MKVKRSKKKKIIAGITLALLVIVIIVGLIVFFVTRPKYYNSRYKYDGVSLEGKWTETDDVFSDEAYTIYDFEIGNNETGSKITYKYCVYGIVALEDDASTYRIEKDNTMIMYYYVGKTLEKKEYKFSISDDKQMLVLMDGNKEITLKKYDLKYNQDDRIYGTWKDTSDDTQSYIFNEDHTGVFGSTDGTNSIVFSTKNSCLYMFIDELLPIDGYTLSSDFVQCCEYSIDDTGLLTLKVGSKVFYAKKE